MGKILGNIATRMMFIIYITIILLTAFFIVFGYYNQLSLQEDRQHDRLTAIVTSIAISIDGDEHQKMTNDHLKKNDITKNEENAAYLSIHNSIKKAAESNDLTSPIYTLMYEEDKGYFEFGVTSDPEPYYRHSYKNYPQLLLDSMDVGGVIPSYESENGVWLSAFCPIKNRKGETVAILESDAEFTSFIADVRKEYLNQALISLAVIVLISIFLITYSRKILKEEERRNEEDRLQKAIIEEKNKDITDSINYALKIQSAILPSISLFDKLFEDSFIYFKPKDIVAGDFYFLEEFEGDAYLAVADCTGHGVPGAMVSMICSNALNYVVHDANITDPGKILDAVTDIVIQKFQMSPDGIKDGMDICLCKINREKRTVEYAGANNALYIIKNGSTEIETIKPNKQPIGQFSHRVPFDTHKLQMAENDIIYLFTDGFADQFGGEKGKKMKYKPFKQLLINNHKKPLCDQKELLNSGFDQWMRGFEQVDDVCVAAVKF